MFPFACVCAWGCLRHLTRPIRTVQPRSKRERNSTRWRLPSHENQTPSQLEGEVPVLARGTLGALAANLAADAERSGNAALCTQLRRFAVSGGGGPVREAVFSGMDGPTCVTQLRAWCGPDDAAFLELATKLKLKDCTWMLLSALPCGGCVGSRHCFVVLSILRDLSLFFGAQIPPLRLLPSPMPPAFAPTLRHTQSIYHNSCFTMASVRGGLRAHSALRCSARLHPQGCQGERWRLQLPPLLLPLPGATPAAPHACRRWRRKSRDYEQWWTSSRHL